MKVQSLDKIGIGLTILSPFAGLLRSIIRFRYEQSKFIFIIFCIYYGSIFIYQKQDTRPGLGPDSSHYALLFKESNSIKNVGFIEFYDKLGDHEKLDYYNPIIIYLLSRVTGNPHLYFMLVASIFGFFYANNIWDVISYCSKRLGALIGIVLIVYSLTCTLYTIGGVRMHTGFQVFFFGFFSYLMNGKKNRLIWIPISGLIHFSLFYLVAVAALFFVLRNLKKWPFFVFFIVAHLINELDLEIVQHAFSFLPNNLNLRLSLYSREEDLVLLKETGKFFLGPSNMWARIDVNILRFFILTYTSVLFLSSYNEINKSQKLNELLKFSLLVYGFSLIIANLPSGYRFISISSMFIFAFYAILLNENYEGLSSWAKVTLRIAFPFLLVYVLRIVRMILDSTNISLIAGNFFSSFLFDSNVTILDMVKKLL